MTVQIRSTSETDKKDGVIEPSVVGTCEEIFEGISGHVNMELHQMPQRPLWTEASEGTLSTRGTQLQSTVLLHNCLKYLEPTNNSDSRIFRRFVRDSRSGRCSLNLWPMHVSGQKQPSLSTLLHGSKDKHILFIVR